MKSLLWMAMIIFCQAPAMLAGVSQKQQQKNLVAFTKLWGYVKHFYPGDEAQEIDWDKFAAYGSMRVMNMPDHESLTKALQELFSPIVYDLDLYTNTPKQYFVKDSAPDSRKAFWQYLGYNNNTQSPLQRSIRTNRPIKIFPNDQIPYLWTWICPQLNNPDLEAGKLRVSFRIKQEKEDPDNTWIMLGYKEVSVKDSLCSNGWTSKSYVLEPKNEDRGAFWMFFSHFELLWLDDLKVEKWTSEDWEQIYFTSFSNDILGSLPQNLCVNLAPDMGVLSPKVDALVDEHEGTTMLKICAASPDKPFTLGIVDKIFPEELPWGERLDKELISGIRCNFPMVLECDLEHTYPLMDQERIKNLVQNLEPVDLEDRNSRGNWLAGIVKYWNELNFFYPYFEYDQCDWDQELALCLSRVIKAKSFAEYKQALRRLSSKTQDGHAYIGDPASNKLIPGFGVILLDGKWIVDKVLSNSLKVPPGSEVTHMNGRSFKKIMDESRPLYDSSNPETTNIRLFRAYLRDYPDSLAIFRFKTPEMRSITQQVVFGDYDSHRLKIREEKYITYPDSIVYLNLYSITDAEITALMPELQAAKGIILDLRLYPYVSPDILRHFLIQSDTSGYCITKRWIRPFEELPRFNEDAPVWGLEPKEPHLSAKLIVLSSRDSQSYCEGFLEVIKHNKLGTIIGQSSAGANGNTVSTMLPGDLKVYWTGLLVQNTDRSRFFGLGVSPDLLVIKTLDDVIHGCDPELEKALEFLRAGL